MIFLVEPGRTFTAMSQEGRRELGFDYDKYRPMYGPEQMPSGSGTYEVWGWHLKRASKVNVDAWMREIFGMSIRARSGELPARPGYARIELYDPELEWGVETLFRIHWMSHTNISCKWIPLPMLAVENTPLP